MEGSLIGHGAYIKWPTGVIGARKIINIRSKENDCVPLSIAEHLIHDKLPQSARKNPDKALKYYKQKVK